MADDILINIRTVGVDQVQKASAQIAQLGTVSEQLVGKLSASSRMIMRQVQADKNLASTKAELQRAVKNNIITQGQMNQAMKEAHRQARLLVATDKELVAAEKEKLRIKREAEAKEAKHAQYVDELRRKYDAQYQQEQALNQTKREYNTLLAAGAISQEEFNHLIAKAEAEARDFEAALAKGGNQFGRFNLEAYRSAQTLKRQVNAQVQQAGYQIGDFFVQIQSGTDFLVAFGQQASQLAGAFNQIGRFSGPMVGAFIAIGTAAGTVATQLYKTWTNTQDLDEALEGLTEQRQEIEELFELLQSGPEAIADKFTIATEKIKAMSLELARFDLDKLERTNIQGVNTFAQQPAGRRLLGIGGTSYAAINQRFEGTLGGLNREQRQALQDEYNVIADAFGAAEGDPMKRYEEFKRLGDLVISYGGKLPEEFLTAQDALNKFAQEHDRLTLSIAKLEAELAKTEYETGFSRALRRGELKVEDLLPSREVMRTVVDEYIATTNETVQARMDQLGRNRGYMSRAAGVVGAGQASKGDVTRYNDALRIRSALETAYLQDTVEREEKSQQKINNIYKLYGKTRYESDLDAAAAAETKRQALIERNRKIIGGIEQDLADSYIEGVRKRIDEEQKLAAEKKKQEDRQKRIDDAASNANKLQMIKNNLLADELQYGKDSDTYRRYAVIAAGQIAAIQARSKGVSEALVEEARILAEQQERAKFNLADSVAHARELARELKVAAQAMTALGNVGDSVEMALIKANAQVAALSTGGDLATAGRIAGLREENRRAMNEAIAAGGDMSGIMSEYTQTESSIDALAKALQIIADSRGKTGGGDNLAKNYKEYLDGLRNELKIAEELKDVHGEEYTLQRDLLLLKQKYGILVTAEDEVEIERAQRRIKEIEKQKALQEELADTISSSMGDAFMSIMDGTESAKDAFKNMADFIVKELFRILVMEQMVDSIKGSILGPDAKEANGGAYMGGNRLAFAKGGVVTGPTYFPMSRGRTGLMGEAGPEAIMPLERGSDGKLGVKASGGQSVVVNQSFNFSANGDDSVKRIIAQEAPKIADMTTATIMDQRRRGGAMRKAFN